jgi:hypothetical protein
LRKISPGFITTAQRISSVPRAMRSGKRSVMSKGKPPATEQQSGSAKPRVRRLAERLKAEGCRVAGDIASCQLFYSAQPIEALAA